MRIYDYTDSLYQTYELALERRNLHEELSMVSVNELQTSNNKEKFRNSEKRLQSYLERLDIKTLEVIRAVLYIGIDYFNDTEECISNPSSEIEKAIGHYHDDKDTTISIICGKMILDQYLKKGFEVLRIE